MASQVVEALRSRIQDLLQALEQEPAWQALTSDRTPAGLKRLMMREVYAEIAAYQPDVIEATIAVIGTFPRSLAARKVRAMLVHQAEEWDHGEMAIRDFVGTGGDQAALGARRPSPTAFATAAFWRHLAHKRLPFAYLGALYLFEGLTPIVTARVKEHLVSSGFTPDTLEYIEFHSTEDVRHARIVDALIEEVAQQYPEAAGDIEWGFDAFRHVYPLPGWAAAFARAQAAFRDEREAAGVGA